MMTLEEAIEHCKDVALSCTNKECALEHFQLLKWLQEYSNIKKQGEKSIDKVSKEVTKDEESSVNFLKSSGIMNNNSKLAEEYRQEEENPVDKIKPKFKPGDWIVDIIYDKAMQVLFLEDDGYEFENGIWISYTDAKERVHLWTIQDAKDGDVLQLDEITAIFKKYIDNERCLCYCSFCRVGGFDIPIVDGEDDVYGCYNATPATKEQRDLLFQKMKEAGYEWDAEKKELKKIHVIDEGKAEMDYCFTKMMNGEKINPAWGEEDERLCSCLIEEQEESLDNVENDKYGHSEIISDLKDMYRERINWLKSLKDKVQPQWKPSDEQMQALAEALSLAKNCGEESAFDLRTLHEQLKKLK